MRPKSLVTGLFATALGVRLLCLVEWWRSPLATVLLGDGLRYDEWAREIAAGAWLGREAFYQAPLYPYFLAAIYSVVGPNLLVVRLVQFALGAAAVVAVALAGTRYVSPGAGLAAGVLLALYAPAVFYDGLVQKACLDGFFMAALLWVLSEHRERGTRRLALAAGLVLGAFALTRENAMVLIPVGMLALELDRPARAPGRRGARAALLLAGVALFLAPVAARNAWLSGGFLPTTSQLGTNFYIGNHAEANGRYLPLRQGRGSPEFEREDATELAQAALGRELSPSEVSRYWLSRSLAFIQERPGEWLALLVRKAGLVAHADEIVDTESLEAYADRSTLLRALSRFLHFGTLLPLAALGVSATRRNWRRLWQLHAAALALAASVALFYVMGRYRYPLVPVLAIFAGAGVEELYRRLRAKSKAAIGRAALLLALVAIPCNWPLRGDVDPRTITWYSLGLELVESGRYAEGRGELERALALDPDFADPHAVLGRALLAEDDARGALVHFDEAMRLGPRHAQARTGAAMALLQLGDARGAEGRLREALALDPLLVVAHNNLAVVLARQGRNEEALDAARAAVRLGPEDVTSRLNLARLLLALGRTDEARAEVEGVLGIDPENAAARRLLER